MKTPSRHFEINFEINFEWTCYIYICIYIKLENCELNILLNKSEDFTS